MISIPSLFGYQIPTRRQRRENRPDGPYRLTKPGERPLDEYLKTLHQHLD